MQQSNSTKTVKGINNNYATFRRSPKAKFASRHHLASVALGFILLILSLNIYYVWLNSTDSHAQYIQPISDPTNNYNPSNHDFINADSDINNLLVDPPLSDWSINWRYLLLHSNLLISAEENLTIHKWQNLNSYFNDEWLQTLANAMKWNQENYIGYCKSSFYPIIGFATLHDESSRYALNQNAITIVNVKTSIQNIENKNATNVNNKENLNQNDNKNDNENQIQNENAQEQEQEQGKEKTNENEEEESGGDNNVVYKIDYSLYNWYNTSDIRSDLQRVQWFQKRRSFWKMDYVTLRDTNVGSIVEIMMSRNEPMFISGKLVQALHTIQDAAVDGNRFLCVFNDGTTIISKRLRPRRGFRMSFIIECDLNDNENGHKLKEKIFNQWYNDKSKLNGINNDNNNGGGIGITTNIGLSVFSLHPKVTKIELLNEYLIAMHTQIPVCYKYQIDSKPQIYNSEKEYYINNDHVTKHIQTTHNSNLSAANPNRNINTNSNGDTRNDVININAKNYNDNDNDYKHVTMIETDWLFGMEQQKHQQDKDENKDKDKSIGNANVNVNVNNVKPSKRKQKYFLSAASVLHPKSRTKQMDIMLEQWIDYYLFQGFEHFYLYDHLFNRDKNDIHTFWNILLQYFEKGLITYIQWPMSQKQKERRYFQINAFLHATRWFGYQTNYLSMTDIDEWIIIAPKDKKQEKINININNNNNYGIPNLKQLYQASVGKSKQNKKTPFTYHVLIDLPSMPDMKNLFYFPDKVKVDSKKLGCDGMNIENRFDTYIQRQSCLYHKIQNKNMLPKISSSKNIDNEINTIVDNLWMQMLEEQPFKKRNKGQMKNNWSLRIKKMYNYFKTDKWAGGYELKPKIIIDPKVMYIGYQHSIYYYTPKYKKINFQNDKYEIFLLHMIDHWRNSEKRDSLIAYKNRWDMKIFINMTDSQCDYENIILWWNQQFLKSKYGNRYVNKSQINPLIDKDGIFCYLKDTNYQNVWIAGNRRLARLRRMQMQQNASDSGE